MYSVLSNIHLYDNMELHFFDTKKSDGIYLDNLKSFWIFRYADTSKYVDIFEWLFEEMKKIQETIWASSNIIEYNNSQSDSKKKIKEKIIIINEFFSLPGEYSWADLIRFTNIMTLLTSQSASAGYKIILLSQSMRKWSSTAMGSVLVNIKNKFVLQLLDMREKWIISRGMSIPDTDRVHTLSNFRALYIENNEIQQEFKAYLIIQKNLKDWVEKNLQNAWSNIWDLTWSHEWVWIWNEKWS